jgi:hypothetical protein
MELVDELEGYFDEQTEGLLLDWFLTKYEIPLRRLVPTELVKRV